jgi:hypothetical protein
MEVRICCKYLRNACFAQTCKKLHIDWDPNYPIKCEHEEKCWYHGDLMNTDKPQLFSSEKIDSDNSNGSQNEVCVPFQICDWKYNELSYYISHPSSRSRPKRSVDSYQKSGFSGISHTL